jgi:hypothetical protein
MTDQHSRAPLLSNFRGYIQSIVAQLRPHGVEERRRRALLPAWIRFFSWIFLAMSAGVPVAFLVNAITGAPVTFSLYGLRHTGSSLDAPAIIIALLLILSGIAAYGLLWGRPWGLDAGLGVGILGVAASVISIGIALGQARRGPNFSFPLNIIFQVPFVIQLWRLQEAWEQSPAEPTHSHAA